MLIILFAGLGGALSAGVLWGPSQVESEVRRRVVAFLRRQHLESVGVEVDGRDVRIFGALPTEADEARVLRGIGGLGGVRRVVGDFEPSAAPKLTEPIAATSTSTAVPADPSGLVSTRVDSAEARALALGLSDVLSQQAIAFDVGSASLTAQGRATVRRVAELMRERSSLFVRIGGHTDDTGSAAKNTILSQQRAQAVAEALVENGVPRRNLDAVGFGSTQPVASNRTHEGRAKNRRIEFTIGKGSK